MSWNRIQTFFSELLATVVATSGMLAVGLSVVALVYLPDERWLQPFIIAGMTVVTQFAHTSGQRRHAEALDAERRRHDEAMAKAAREHAEGMAAVARGHDEALKRLEAQLASGALRFSLRVEASAEVIRAIRDLVNNAAGIVRSLDHAEGTPNELPTVWFFKAAEDALTRLHANAERLRLLAEEPTIKIVDEVLAALDDLDGKHQRHQWGNLPENLDDDEAALREALQRLRAAHGGLVAEARARILA